MKTLRYCIIFLALALLSNSALAQFGKSRLSASVFSVNKEDLDETNRPSLNESPYLTATFYFRNRRKFEDKKYIRKILNVKYFYVESSFSYTTLNKDIIDIKAPLFIIEKKKGTYSSSLLEDFTLVNKIPYSAYGSSIPSVSCYTKRVSKNKLALIGELTSLYKPFIGTNPIGSLTDVTSFVDDVVKKFAQDQTLEVKASFPAFNVRDLNIKPFSYKVLLYHSNSDDLRSENLVLKDQQGYLSLHSKSGGAQTKPLANPYIIIEIGLSNYLALGGLPSETLDPAAICSISRKEIDDYKAFLEENERFLSRNQIRNEAYLIGLLEQSLWINEGVEAERDGKTDLIIKSYDTYYDFKYSPNNKTGELFEDHYKDLAEAIKSCINNTRLAYVNSCNVIIDEIKIRPWTDYQSFNQAKNAKAILDTDGSGAMENTRLYRNISDRLEFYELSLYNAQFRGTINDLSTELSKTTRLTSAIELSVAALGNQIRLFPDCDLCKKEVDGIREIYIAKITDSRIRNLLEKKNKLETEGLRTLSKLEDFLEALENQMSTENSPNSELTKKKNEINSEIEELKKALEGSTRSQTSSRLSEVEIETLSELLDTLEDKLEVANISIGQMG